MYGKLTIQDGVQVSKGLNVPTLRQTMVMLRDILEACFDISCMSASSALEA